MKDIFNHITELQSIRYQKEKLTEREKELIRPLLSDFEDIKLVYDIFTGIIQKAISPSKSMYEYKKKFIAIVYLLFAPEVLAGGRMPHYLRKYIGDVLNISESFISHNIGNVPFQYLKTRSYREEFNYLYYEIIRELKASGKLRTSGW